MKVKKNAFFSETFGGLLAHFGFMKQGFIGSIPFSFFVL